MAKRLPVWPILRQLRGDDRLGLGEAARSSRSAALQPRTVEADRVARSVCPYCAVGCGQRVFVKDDQVIQIEGDPDSPVSRGRLCPKGAASKSLVTGPLRETKVKYRRPHGTEWEELDLEHGDGHDRRPGRGHPGGDLAGPRGRQAVPAHPRVRQPGRGDPRQRGELPHQEAVHRPGAIQIENQARI